MFRKSTFVAGLSLLTLTAATPVFAADPPASQPTEQGPKGARGDRAAQLQKTLDQLNLTDDQKKQIQPIVDQLKSDIGDVMKDDKVSQDDKKTKVKDLTKDAMDKITAVLTPEQKQKLQDMRKERGGKKGQGGKTPPPAPAQN